jgi:putative ABC transport system substrate-binding protein
VKRREFIAGLAGAAAWPIAALAQRSKMPVVGFLHARSPDDATPQAVAFKRGLAEVGYVEDRNLLIEYRSARGQYESLPRMAAELVSLPATVLFAGTEPAAKAATSTTPIVFSIGSDPVEQGLVASYNRPGGNATGVSMFTATLEPKRFGLLREIVPHAATIGMLVNPNTPCRRASYGTRMGRHAQSVCRFMFCWQAQMTRSTMRLRQ